MNARIWSTPTQNWQTHHTKRIFRTLHRRLSGRLQRSWSKSVNPLFSTPYFTTWHRNHFGAAHSFNSLIFHCQMGKLDIDVQIGAGFAVPRRHTSFGPTLTIGRNEAVPPSLTCASKKRVLVVPLNLVYKIKNLNHGADQ